MLEVHEVHQSHVSASVLLCGVCQVWVFSEREVVTCGSSYHLRWYEAPQMSTLSKPDREAFVRCINHKCALVWGSLKCGGI